MIEFLGVPISVVNMSGWGAFLLLSLSVVRAFITGKIRTEREVVEVRQDRDARIAAAEKWETAFHERGRTVQQLLKQQEMLLVDFGATAVHALESLPQGGETGP